MFGFVSRRNFHSDVGDVLLEPLEGLRIHDYYVGHRITEEHTWVVLEKERAGLSRALFDRGPERCLGGVFKESLASRMQIYDC